MIFGKPTDFYLSPEWRELRKEALDRYGGRCMACGAVNEIEVDHIKPRAKYGRLKLKLSNCQIMCSTCNKRKGTWTIDFRPFKWKLYYATIKLFKCLILLSVLATIGYNHARVLEISRPHLDQISAYLIEYSQSLSHPPDQ